MKPSYCIANSLLWAAAIIAAVISHAPTFFTVFLLPVLATGSLLLTRPRSRPSR